MKTTELDRWIEELAPFDSWNERMIMTAFALFGLPSSYLDVGSGTGAMVNLARKIGVDAWGVDQIPRPDSWLVTGDLSQPLDLARQFALVTCLEIAEHIAPESEAVLCDTVVRHVASSGLLVWSAAHPGQNGTGHVNCRPANYWRTQMHDRDLTYQPEASARLALLWSVIPTPQFWLAANLQIFSR